MKHRAWPTCAALIVLSSACVEFTRASSSDGEVASSTSAGSTTNGGCTPDCSTGSGLDDESGAGTSTGPSTCEFPLLDCDQDAATGCETDVRVSTEHCGACAFACEDGASCSEGDCVQQEPEHAAPSIAGALGTTCATVTGGEVYCWGAGRFGQLGNGSTDNTSVPGIVPGLVDVVDLSARNGTMCARTSGREVFCWGENEFGEVGDGGDEDRMTPVRVGVTDIVQLDAGESHVCAVDGIGATWCWGANDRGQLGLPPDDEIRAPVRVEAAPLAESVHAGNLHTCIRTAEAAVHCWGGNDEGQLGDGTRRMRHEPGPPIALDAVAEVATGRKTTCARLEAGDVYCWGRNKSGEVGSTAVSGNVIEQPARVEGLEGVTVTALDHGGGFACARGDDGTLYCWGDSKRGQLERTGEDNPTAPVRSLTLVDRFDGGGHHLCGWSNRRLHCIGRNAVGQLGDGTTEDSSTAVAVVGLPR